MMNSDVMDVVLKLRDDVMADLIAGMALMNKIAHQLVYFSHSSFFWNFKDADVSGV